MKATCAAPAEVPVLRARGARSPPPREQRPSDVTCERSRAVPAARDTSVGWLDGTRCHNDGDMPLHPKLVHLPIALAVLMPLLSLLILGGWWRGLLPRRTWLLVAGFQALLVVSGLAASKTGERDEERAEQIVPESAIEAHEEAAETFVGASAAVLVLVVLAAVVPRERTAQALAAAAIAGTLLVLALGYRVGEAGGRLVYEHGAAAAWTGAPAHDDD
jgi:uncharacterized membrane protein